MPRTGFPIENVGNDRRLNTSMRAPLPPDRTKARPGLSFLSCPPAVSFLSCPPVVSGHPGFSSLSSMPRTGFPIKDVGNDGRLNTSMRATLLPDRTKARAGLSFLSCPPVVSGHPGFYSLSSMPRTGFPIENVGNDRRLNTSMRAPLPPDRTKARPGLSFLSCPPVVSGHPGFYSLSLVPRTGFPIKDVGNDRRLNTSMRAPLPPDRAKARPGFSVCHSCWLFPFCHARRLLAGIQGFTLCHEYLGLDSRLKTSGMTEEGYRE